MRAPTGFGTIFLLGTVVAGCGGGGSSKPLTVADFCDQKATQECQIVSRCAPLTQADCKAQRTALCMQFATASQTAPRVFTAGNVGRCIDKVKSVYAQASAITPTQLSDLADLCNYVFQGNVDKLMPCTVK